MDDEAVNGVDGCGLDAEAWMLDADVFATAGVVKGPLDADADVGVGDNVAALDDVVLAVVAVDVGGVVVLLNFDGDECLPVISAI